MRPSYRHSKRAAESEKVRQRLLNVSLELFVARGYDGTTIRGIAQQAGVSPGLVFHYFSSKQAILEEHIKTLNGGVAQVAQLLSDTPAPLETFDKVAKIVLDSLATDRGRLLFLFANYVAASESVPKASRELLDRMQSLDASVHLMSQGQQAGEIRAGDPRSLALVFWGALQGVAYISASLPGETVPSSEYILALLKADAVDTASNSTNHFRGSVAQLYDNKSNKEWVG